MILNDESEAIFFSNMQKVTFLMNITETKNELYEAIISEVLEKYELVDDNKAICKEIIKNLPNCSDQISLQNLLQQIIKDPINYENLSNDIFNQIYPKYPYNDIKSENIESQDLDILSMEPFNKRKKNSSNRKKIEYVLYIAGLEPHQNKIDLLYNMFIQYGEIRCIFTETKERYALIQFADLNSIFLAATSSQKLFDNPYIKIGYATDVDEILESLSNDPKRLIKTKNKALAITSFAESLEKELNEAQNTD